MSSPGLLFGGCADGMDLVNFLLGLRLNYRAILSHAIGHRQHCGPFFLRELFGNADGRGDDTPTRRLYTLHDENLEERGANT